MYRSTLSLYLALTIWVSPCSASSLAPPFLPEPTSPNLSAPTTNLNLFGQTIFHPIYAAHGMVVTDQRLATHIGVEILKKGGNAIDAAVAVGFALAVVFPNAGNLGGGGFMMIHSAKNQSDHALDFREMAPSKAHRTMYLDEKNQVIPEQSLYTHQAIGIPGTVAGLVYALNHFGTMPLNQVMTPAIQLAEEGFEVSQALATTLEQQQEKLKKWPATQAIFFNHGHPLQRGDHLVQKDLAHALQLIAQQGASIFYEGSIGKKIASEMKKYDGLISLEDMKRYRVIERNVIKGNYRGYQIVSMPPPSSGGVHLIELLNILEQFPLPRYGHNSAKSIHVMTEAMKHAYADRSNYLGDPDFTNVPIDALTSKAYAKQLAQQINLEHTTPSSTIKPGNLSFSESDQTTHYSVIDANGNAVSTTYTLNMNFGSGIVAEGTGILLNNEMDDFSIKPGVPNAFGLIGDQANAIMPFKRPLSSMTPTFVLKDGKPLFITGSPGGSRIITTVLQTIINVLDYGMNPAEAVSAPRIHHQWIPDVLNLEQGISPDTIELLKQKGHLVIMKPAMGAAHSIQKNTDGFYGASDPRSADGLAEGY
jgi:gamma-glutamyltranspeptidase / glutathione hydrolase